MVTVESEAKRFFNFCALCGGVGLLVGKNLSFFFRIFSATGIFPFYDVAIFCFKALS